MNAPTAPYLKTLVECHNKMMENGYKEDFIIDEGRLKCVSSDKIYVAPDINIVNFYRFEGQSDPDDNSIMYVLEAADGKKGTLIDAYGAYADPDISAFITEVEIIRKSGTRKL